jgi:hypothetical protein
VAQGAEPDNLNFLQRRWPVLLSLAVLVIVCFVYVAAYSRSPSSWRALLLAVLPSLAATLVIVACVYVLLNRDYSTGQGEASSQGLAGLDKQMVALSEAIGRLFDSTSVLKKRSEVPTLQAMFDPAETISIAAVSGLGLINHYRALLEEQLRLGKTLRVLLLDADYEDALLTWDRATNPPMNTPESDIRSATQMLLGLKSLGGYKGKCEVKLLDTVFPFSAIICRNGLSGSMQVEFHCYRRAPEERPNVLLSTHADPYWYQFFEQQFDLAFANARFASR